MFPSEISYLTGWLYRYDIFWKVIDDFTVARDLI